MTQDSHTRGDADERRSKIVSSLLTPGEYVKVRDHAARHGMTVSDMLRELAVRESCKSGN